MGYRPDTGRVIFLHGKALKVDGTLYEAGHHPTELEERLKELGFTEPEFLSAKKAQASGEQESLRNWQRILCHPNVIVTLTLDEGVIHGISLIGATEDLPADFPRLDWMGPAPTVGGVALGSTPEQVRRALGKPLRIHQRDGYEVFCYEPGDCPDSDDQPVKLHVQFQGDSCRSIRGDQLEQNGQLILHSKFRMPPIHSMGEALAVEDSSSPLTRTTTRETGPRHVVYSPDLNLEVWIYPDGKRQFILRRVELPATVINLEYP